MLVLLSPSKAQDFETPAPTEAHTQPALLAESQLLIKELRGLSASGIAGLMGISERIAELNRKRYKSFRPPFSLSNAKQAAFAFTGDVYKGLDAQSFEAPALDFAQTHIRILSGLYGLLKPLDLIQPYRLEMKIPLKNPRGKNLYDFWGNRLSGILNAELEAGATRAVINLASGEYFKAVEGGLSVKPITPQFKEKRKSGQYQMVGLLAKKARGLMARYIVEQRILNPEALQFFAEDGYRFNVALSKPESPVYTRG